MIKPIAVGAVSMAKPSIAIPFEPRPLTVAEEKRLDVYYYHSPKHDGRLISVTEPCRLALALDLEFDSDVIAYVERPRTLDVDGKAIELCFWLRRRSGLESFLLFRRQPKPSVPALRAEERLSSRLLEAARNAHLSVAIRKPDSLLASRVANATRLELLPYVQAAASLEAIDVITKAVLAHMAAYPTSSFFAIEANLCNPFDWRDVRSATCLLIHQGILKVDFNQKLKVSSAVTANGGSDA